MNKWHKIYIEIAQIISSASYANREKVGAVIVKNNRIISYGYNGTPYGFDNECETNGVTKPEVLHAESNAIAKCAMSNDSTKDANMYITLSPCVNCAKLIIQSGINAVYYKKKYNNQDGIDLLIKAKIQVYEI